MRGFAEEEEKTHRLGQPLPQLGDGRCSLPSHLCHVSLNATPREQHLVRLGTTRKVARCARESAQGVREPRRTPPGAAKTAPLTAAPTRTPPTHALGLRPSGTCRDYKPTRIVRRVSVAFGLLLLSPQTDLAAGDAGILRARAEARLKGGEERPSCARRALHCQGRVYAGLTRSVVYPRRLPLSPSRLGKVSFVIEEANWAKARPWMSAKSTQASSRWSPAFMPLEATRCYLNDEAFRWSFVPRNKGGCRKCHSPLKASSTTHSQRGETFAFTMYLYLHINIASPYALLQTLLGCLAGSLASAPRVRVCACPVRLRGYISKIGSWRW